MSRNRRYEGNDHLVCNSSGDFYLISFVSSDIFGINFGEYISGVGLFYKRKGTVRTRARTFSKAKKKYLFMRLEAKIPLQQNKMIAESFFNFNIYNF